jgi:hypothetical protein
MQLALSYDPAHAGSDDWSLEIAWLRRAVDVIGHKELAYKLDIAPSQLTDALLERERKDVKAKWVKTILRMVPEDMRAEYLRIVNTAHGYKAPERTKPRTPEEENREIRTILLQHAPALLQLVDKELGNR